MHEEATKLHHLLADGLNTGAFLVQVQNKVYQYPVVRKSFKQLDQNKSQHRSTFHTAEISAYLPRNCLPKLAMFCLELLP